MSVEWELIFQALVSLIKILGTGSGLQLHSPGWNQLFLEMNNIVSTNAIAFILFVRFLC